MRAVPLLAGSFLALSVDAFPSFMVGRDPSKYEGTLLTVKAKRNITHPDKSCKDHSPKTWQDLDVDKWLSQYADGWFLPEDPDPQYKGKSFPQVVMEQIGGFDPFRCNLMYSCDFDYDNTQVGCDTGEGTSCGPMDALWMFTLYGLSNFRNYIFTLQDQFQSTATKVIGDDIDGMVTDFSSDPTADDGKKLASEGLVIMAAILGGLSALLSGGETLIGEAAALGTSVGTGVSGGIAGVTNGILSNTEAAAVDEGLVHDERGGIIKQKMNNATGALVESIKQYGYKILEDYPDLSSVEGDGNDMYSAQSWSGPYVLKGGSFAQSNDKIFDDYDLALKNSIHSGVISWLWGLEHVFIVSASKQINGKNPCDLDFGSEDDSDKLGKDMFISACDEDSGTMYWFLKEGSIAAVASQDEGGFRANRTMGQAKDFLRGDKKPPLNLIMNVPVCSLDYLEDYWPSEGDVLDAESGSTSPKGDLTDSYWVRWTIHEACSKFYVNGEAFPYDV
ncbi:hypothetical protein N7474_010027 [Penicillium riverlandense]|uniref:uncharacterized protein n=1 Tax=Penicillium riverlandense TaxID=1903569 RepID=UPI0025489779|nr:uncharacterized protein N7474_010027 [Penicillium riverlandense]KAJ5808758.1 hypothetical protein N7474_010027 [Penicillium riverlandense]